MQKFKSQPESRRASARMGIAAGAVTGAVLAVAASPAYAAAGTLSLSNVYGPTGGTNTITATLSPGSSPNPTAFTTTTNAQFVAMATTSTQCPAIYTSPGTNLSVTNVRYLGPTKIAVTVPTAVTVASGAASTNWKLCTYNGTATGTGGSALVAQATYTVGNAPTITSISPSFGPSLGGTMITLTGTNIVKDNLSATLDNVPLTSVSYVDSTHFTGVVPAHAAGGPYNLAVTTPGGTVNTLANGSKADLFTYSNGVVTSPNTAPMNAGTVDVDLQGVGFSGIDFVNTTGNTPGEKKGHVYLVRGDYDPTTTSNPQKKTNGPTDECTGVVVISDKELLCSLDLTVGVRQTRTVNDAVYTNGGTTVTSVAAGFTSTAVDAGKSIAGPGIPAGTTIVSIAGNVATISATTTAAGTNAPVGIGASQVLTAVGVTDGTTALTGGGTAYAVSTGTQCVAGTGIPLGTTITAIAGGGASATLSKAATASGTGLTISIVDCPVPNDTYTLTAVNNGQSDVQAGGANADANYKKAVISSGSTFTVSDF
ncbi:IPT/TIG domain-containing protein [Actinoplanes sp. NPDC026619]|uniref:IPT/TIG domain-containing protein n=1 Tax=Actinoplanes sp. NPDC026619 TaxID=3155798 RepID=UPI0033DACB59